MSGAELGELFLILCAAWLIPGGFYAAYKIARLHREAREPEVKQTWPRRRL